jgi:general secretion pathway protein G
MSGSLPTTRARNLNLRFGDMNRQSYTKIWIALLMMLLISTLFFVMSGPAAFGAQSHDAPVPAVKTEFSAIRTALVKFREDCGSYPSMTEGLSALAKRPSAILAGQWHGPYVDHVLTDPWNHEIVYIFPGTHSTNDFDLYSCGLDGVSKTGGSDLDDINSWDRASPHGGDYHSIGFGKYLMVIPGWLWIIITAIVLARVLQWLRKEPKTENEPD